MKSVDCPPIDGLAFAWMVATNVSENLKEFSLGLVTPSMNGYYHPNLQSTPQDDSILTELARRAPNLESLTAQGRLVTDESLHSLGTLCPKLRKVDFRNCSGITRNGVMALLVGCPELEEVNIKGTVANDERMQLAIKNVKACGETRRRRATITEGGGVSNSSGSSSIDSAERMMFLMPTRSEGTVALGQ